MKFFAFNTGEIDRANQAVGGAFESASRIETAVQAENNISLPEPLLAEIQSAAQAEHRTVDEVLTDAVKGMSRTVRGRSYWTMARSGRRRSASKSVTSIS